MSIAEPLADQLERRFGPCPSNRHDFLSWVDDQLERCARLGVPGKVAQQMIETGYVEWRATLLGIDLDWENAPAVGREFPGREQPADQEREPLDDA
ncbi:MULTISPECIES: hypothetical protein [Stutzerimonas stutzeri group]|jgi:hypothetical protein|uniref:hypothetical protein n=1 Tax=Stutzerimonas frequens TaxID=2968969 RepID=UPI00190E215D|nr:hypothetical protein [Stutzerimonas frequens]MBK3874697.1 hypothetical protein [Stutzerimonas frequens]MBK3912960.1 hypothetical protein [Stutzerimonas frequens]MBK3932212.1 hypothetical protein [Stutzerimonas frequens]